MLLWCHLILILAQLWTSQTKEKREYSEKWNVIWKKKLTEWFCQLSYLVYLHIFSLAFSKTNATIQVEDNWTDWICYPMQRLLWWSVIWMFTEQIDKLTAIIGECFGLLLWHIANESIYDACVCVLILIVKACAFCVRAFSQSWDKTSLKSIEHRMNSRSIYWYAPDLIVLRLVWPSIALSSWILSNYSFNSLIVHNFFSHFSVCSTCQREKNTLNCILPNKRSSSDRMSQIWQVSVFLIGFTAKKM